MAGEKATGEVEAGADEGVPPSSTDVAEPASCMPAESDESDAGSDKEDEPGSTNTYALTLYFRSINLFIQL